ncbi:MAG TPA: ribonuclease HII [Candidatus Peribacteria bacterium]|nr:ribonuclease HII [Candidatus Peribacteria bacterium]
MSAVSVAVPKLVVKDRTFVVGIDEAGRGAVAGPVVAGACALPDGAKPPVRIADSKLLSPGQRQESFEWLIGHCLCGVGIVSAQDVDRIGILAATERAMQAAVAEVALRASPLYLLVDGRDAFWFDHPHSSIVRGDQSEPCISAASILAKVTRDKLMCDLGEEYPAYGFAVHKGYGTPGHYAAIEKHGCNPHHRKTFLKAVLQVRGTSTKRRAGT